MEKESSLSPEAVTWRLPERRMGEGLAARKLSFIYSESAAGQEMAG
jgi:hypothetical protein